ncbi:MAG: hypothetical protein QG623_670 [Patescibacteria group bacterium]|nr:hypothetical protein [Patescibacteria group bacterium]
MRSQPIRTSYDQFQDPIEGLRTDPDTHTAGSTDTVDNLARAAIDAAFSLKVTPGQFNLGNEMFTSQQRGQSIRAGGIAAEDDLRIERSQIINAKLGLSPHPNQVEISGDISKWQGEISARQASIPSMQSRLRDLEAARLAPGASPLETEEEINLKQQVALYGKRIDELQRNIVKATETESPTTDPFTAAKLRQEQERLGGIQPRARDALRYEIQSQGISGFLNPRVWADGFRAFRMVRADRGLGARAARRIDRARLRTGDHTIHGAGTERPIRDKFIKSKDKKDNEKSTETIYSRIAQVGQVIEMDNGELLVVQDVQPEVAYITAPDGTEQLLIYPDGTPVVMDDLADALLKKTGSKPQVARVTGLGPTGRPLTTTVDLDSPALLESIHKGEEWVTLGQLFVPEDAERLLLDGVSEDQISPVCIRLNDLVFGLGGDPARRAKIKSEKDRVDILETHVVWQRTVQKPGEHTPPVSLVEGSIKIFDGHDGHFVRPFTYPEQRKQSYLSEIETSREAAGRAAREAELRPPKGGLRDDRRTYYKGPQRRRNFWG